MCCDSTNTIHVHVLHPTIKSPCWIDADSITDTVASLLIVVAMAVLFAS